MHVIKYLYIKNSNIIKIVFPVHIMSSDFMMYTCLESYT